jgi:hypothetical protein
MDIKWAFEAIPCSFMRKTLTKHLQMTDGGPAANPTLSPASIKNLEHFHFHPIVGVKYFPRLLISDNIHIFISSKAPFSALTGVKKRGKGEVKRHKQQPFVPFVWKHLREY